MKRFASGADLAKEMGISPSQLGATFKLFNEAAKSGKDTWGLKFFDGAPYDMKDSFYVSIICPVLHYTMGGIKIDIDANCLKEDGSKIPGVYGAGEVNGEIHGLNRLGGSSLLDCVVFGRVAGASAAKYLLSETLNRPSSSSGGYQGVVQSNVRFNPLSKHVTVDFSWDNAESANTQNISAPSTQSHFPAASSPATEKGPAPAASGSSAPEGKKDRNKVFTLDEVAKHNKKDDCWVVVNGQVLDTTKFLPDHPGGPKAILLYAGKDATEEFNMLHEPSVVERYAPETIIGKISK